MASPWDGTCNRNVGRCYEQCYKEEKGNGSERVEPDCMAAEALVDAKGCLHFGIASI